MSISVQHSDNIDTIAPLLKVLRDGLADDVFHDRLKRALDNGYRVLIAEDQGCLGYRITHDVFWGKTLFIDDLVVRPDMRNFGIGKALLNAAKQEASAHGCDHIRLCSGLTRQQAHRFYEQNGFARTSLQFCYALTDGAS